MIKCDFFQTNFYPTEKFKNKKLYTKLINCSKGHHQPKVICSPRIIRTLPAISSPIHPILISYSLLSPKFRPITFTTRIILFTKSINHTCPIISQIHPHKMSSTPREAILAVITEIQNYLGRNNGVNSPNHYNSSFTCVGCLNMDSESGVEKKCHVF